MKYSLPCLNRLIDLGFSLEQIAKMLETDAATIEAALEPSGGFPVLITTTIKQRLQQYICATQHTIRDLPIEVQDRVAAQIASSLRFEGELLEAERARAASTEPVNLTNRQKDALRLVISTLTYSRRTQVFVDKVILARHVWQLAEMTDEQILRRGADAGRKPVSCTWMLDQIKEALKRRGLETGMKIPADVKGIASRA